MRNLKPLSLFVFFCASACEWIFIKTHIIESRCVIGPGNILRASFSPEILQAGAVKGLAYVCTRTCWSVIGGHYRSTETDQITADMFLQCSAISYRTVSSIAVTVFRSMIRMYREIRSSWCGKANMTSTSASQSCIPVVLYSLKTVPEEWYSSIKHIGRRRMFQIGG